MSETENWVTLAQAYQLAVEAFGSQATAELVLTQAMRAGTIAMRGDYFDGNFFNGEITLTEDFLYEKGNIIWTESRIEQKLKRIDTKGKAPNYLHLGEFHRIKINRDDMGKLWPEMDPQANSNMALPISAEVKTVQSQPDPPVSVPRAGGRPPKYDWEGAFIEMARVAILEEDCDRPTLVRAVQDWFARTEQEPAESLIREKVRRFHETIWPAPKT